MLRTNLSALSGAAREPLFVLCVAHRCGVTGLPLRTYALGTLFGIVPGSLVFVNAGASLAVIE